MKRVKEEEEGRCSSNNLLASLGELETLIKKLAKWMTKKVISSEKVLLEVLFEESSPIFWSEEVWEGVTVEPGGMIELESFFGRFEEEEGEVELEEEARVVFEVLEEGLEEGGASKFLKKLMEEE